MLLHRDHGPDHLSLGSLGCCRLKEIPYREQRRLQFSGYALLWCTLDEVCPGCQQASWGFHPPTLSFSARRSRCSDPQSQWTAARRAWCLADQSTTSVEIGRAHV